MSWFEEKTKLIKINSSISRRPNYRKSESTVRRSPSRLYVARPPVKCRTKWEIGSYNNKMNYSIYHIILNTNSLKKHFGVSHNPQTASRPGLGYRLGPWDTWEKLSPIGKLKKLPRLCRLHHWSRFDILFIVKLFLVIFYYFRVKRYYLTFYNYYSLL